MRVKQPVAVCIIVENESVPYDTRVWQQAKTLTRAGYKVSVICPNGYGSTSLRETLDDIDIYRYFCWTSRGALGHLLEYGWSLLAQFYLALKVYAHSRFRVLHACNPPDTIFLIALFFKVLGVKFIFDHHDLCPELYLSKYGRRNVLYRVVCAAEVLTFWSADLSLATNESYRQIAVQRGGMKPGRVFVVQSCADLEKVNQPPKHRQPSHKDRLLVLYIGNMESQDGLDLLLQSIEYIMKQKRDDRARFLLIGSGTELPRLQALAKQMQLNGEVEFTGQIPHHEVFEHLSDADVCVAPDPRNSLNDKSSMTKIFEYMAFGKPTVLYDLTEGRRSAGGAALYAQPNDPVHFAEQILQLLDSEPLRRELGELGKKRVNETLNWQEQSRRLLDAYETVLQRRRHVV